MLTKKKKKDADDINRKQSKIQAKELSIKKR